MGGTHSHRLNLPPDAKLSPRNSPRYIHDPNSKRSPSPQSNFLQPKRTHNVVPPLQTDTREDMTSLSTLHHETSEHAILEYVANSIIGKDVVFSGPFGQRKVLYLDYIASGRQLTFIEEYITKEVLPYYANTHTSTSYTARQTTALRNDARNIIRTTTNATEEDAVIFTGNGVTGAIHKLIHALNFTEPPVVFISPYEHHSNILPWREIHADVIRIKQTADGLVDLAHLEEELKEWSKTGRRLVGSMTAASNVTGILCDVDNISILLHKYGALALWDYATAAPYVKLDINPALPGKDQALVYKDAIFVSPHKFVGGVSSPGLLIAKKKLFLNKVPHDCGGGTVLVVRQTGHRYLKNLEEREEGGTPAIVGAIRAGLTFQLKAAITPELIMQREQELFRRAREAWSSLPNLFILGNLGVERLPIFSFLVQHPTTGYYLHHNFVACLLNDLFGIQARGGCACAGPYAMDLLGISEEKATEIEELLVTEKQSDKKSKRASRHSGDSAREIFKPGFTRLNLPYFLNEEQLNFVLQAVAMVAEHGWKLLPQYKFNPKTGEWKHEQSQESKQLRRLAQLSYTNGYPECHRPKFQAEENLPESFHICLDKARKLFEDVEKNILTIPDQSHLFEDFEESSRWFLLPSEANEILRVFSHISSLGPAKPFIVPRNAHTQSNGLLSETPHGHLSSPRTTTTSLGSSLNGSENWGKVSAQPAKAKGKKFGKSKPAVQRITVQGYQKDGQKPDRS